MAHDVLVIVFMLISVSPLLFVLWWSKSQMKRQQDLSLERRWELKKKMLEVMLPHGVKLWMNLLDSIQERKPKIEQEKRAKEIYDYVRCMSKV